LFDQLVDIIRLARVFFLTTDQDVDLPPAGRERPETSFHSEQQKLSNVAEVEPHSAAIRPAIFSHLVPNEIGLVLEPPRLHHFQPLGEQGVGAPQIKVALLGRECTDRECPDLRETQSLIPAQALVFGRDLAGAIGEPPGRIDEYRRERSPELLELLLWRH